ncbi:MAG: Asp-tRNA(Asn)/Glu-tRNA(Gln) amidotransferase subunit GatB [Candidatus Pacearchaeota archaeon]|nr:Asp-tRNA(Asn)/Glu-tRNA(Gln) amidotransferase subunit GatB [Candidatus Pacearchaeota archaeon]
MVKIGLEIHGYINTNEKLFCRCRAQHGLKFSKPNTNICPVCTSQPGSKPMLPNKTAIDKAIQIGLILKCKINSKFIWQRKHYDWPDLPKGYQDTVSGGHAIPIGEKGEFLGIRIREAHLEEDPAAWNPKTGEIDYNRSGLPLIEIVTEPDFSSSQQVIDWLKQLVITLGYIKTLDKSAGIKADVNISLPELNGKRIEVKNVNSLKNIKALIEIEIERQKSDTPKIQETRMFDEAKGITIKMREKEQTDDYRFISDPDLPVVIIKQSRIEKIKSAIPETPFEKLQRLIKKYNIEKKSAEVLTKKLEIVEFFEKIVEKVNAKLAVPWVTIELLSVLNYNKKELDEVDISPEHFIELLKLVENKKITELKAKDILRKFIPKSFSPLKEAEKQGKISSENELEKICRLVLSENPKAIQDYKEGKQESLHFLIGKIMQKTNKRADFKTTREILERILK